MAQNRPSLTTYHNMICTNIRVCSVPDVFSITFLHFLLVVSFSVETVLTLIEKLNGL